jgi:hypothetical protein
MKVKIAVDEAYPVYYLNNAESYGDEKEVPNHLLEKWLKVFASFQEVQDEIATFVGDDHYYGLYLSDIEEIK